MAAGQQVDDARPSPLMSDVIFSKHAAVGCVQRGIDNTVVDIVLSYGRENYDNKGGCRYFLGHPEKRRLSRDAPELVKKLGRKLDTVVVTTSRAPALVITTFVRSRRY